MHEWVCVMMRSQKGVMGVKDGALERKRMVGIVVCVAIVGAMLSGCGHDESAETGTSAGGDDEISQMMDRYSGQKTASSLSEYIDQVIRDLQNEPAIAQADPSGKTLKERVAQLRRAKERGGLTVSEYESAWSGYKQCMLDRGYKEIILIKLPNGLYKEAGHRMGTSEQESRYSDDTDTCMALNVFGLDSVYNTQVGNPGLYRNQFEGILDCLRRADLTPKDYDVDDLRRDLYEQSPEKRAVDTESPDARGCFIANSLWVASNNDPMEELW